MVNGCEMNDFFVCYFDTLFPNRMIPTTTKKINKKKKGWHLITNKTTTMIMIKMMITNHNIDDDYNTHHQPSELAENKKTKFKIIKMIEKEPKNSFIVFANDIILWI